MKLLVISGSMGTGKTTIMAEASDILSAQGVEHAAIDVDSLGTAHLPRELSDDLTCRNLASVWGNYAAVGVKRLLLACAIEDGAELDRLYRTLQIAEGVVCRLRAGVQTMEQRIRVREPGMLQEQLVRRAVELEAVLDRTHVEDFSIANDDRPVTDVAHELLRRAGWL
ncbi:MAG: hypothetical protein HYS05_03480 [Acidobacteria bacterium]|nr:hypothetical protein [Acidobacteriota bacterium]